MHNYFVFIVHPLCSCVFIDRSHEPRRSETLTGHSRREIQVTLSILCNDWNGVINARLSIRMFHLYYVAYRALYRPIVFINCIVEP